MTDKQEFVFLLNKALPIMIKPTLSLLLEIFGFGIPLELRSLCCKKCYIRNLICLQTLP